MSNISLDHLWIRLKPVFDKYGARRAFVFGSAAHGEAVRRNDIDLIVIQETDKHFLALGVGDDGALGDLVASAGLW